MARRQAAFTLLEILLVLAIGAASYVLVVRVTGGGVSGAELKSAARTVAAGLRSARGDAIASQDTAALTLDLEKRVIRVTGAPGSMAANNRSYALPERIDLKLYTAQSEIVDDKVGSIRFYPDGSSTGGRVTVASREREFLVDVDWLTGRVTIKEGQGT